MNSTVLDRAIGDMYRDRKWIVVVDVAATAAALVRSMLAYGAAGVMLVSSVEGVGELPEVPTHYIRTSGNSIMEGVRAFEGAVANPSSTLREAVARFDPAGEALAIVSPFSVATHIAGRRVYGAKRPEWASLEDKTIADDLWDAARIEHALSAVVAVADAAEAASRLAGDDGSVWVADNKEGWHGGGEYVRWIRSAAETEAALEWFADHADRVRVMPFLEGIPCSIHGFVTHDGIAVLRPLEMLVLRRTDRTGFVYAGAANFWDPAAADRSAMCEAARSVGHVLRERVGYLGPYGIDGILTVDGFRPTELNPRLSVGHAIVAEASGIPLGSIARGLIEGVVEIAATELEPALVEAGDARRGGGVRYSMAESQPDRAVDVRFVAGSAFGVAEGERIARVATGRSPQGGLVLVNFDRERLAPGRSVAPLAVAALDFARSRWALPVPPVAAAPEVRDSG